MIRRLLSFLCALLILFSAVQALSESTVFFYSYDFDLAFTLNSDSFPAMVRTRTAGYADLIDRLGLRGNLSWSKVTQSFDLEAELYFTDDPSLSYPFRLFGSEARIFLTSPLIRNEVILLNMAGMIEFSLKAKNTLGIPLPYIALLIPYSTTHALTGMIRDWNDTVGDLTKGGKISSKTLRNLASLWSDELLNNEHVRWWIMALSTGSEVPYAVEDELNAIPAYCESIAAAGPMSVTVEPGLTAMRSASGDVLFTRGDSEEGFSLSVALPASGNGYLPRFSFVRRNEGDVYSCDISASYSRESASGPAPDSAVVPDGEDEDVYPDVYEDDAVGYADYYETEEGLPSAGNEYPQALLDFTLHGSGLPRVLPADSAFSVSASNRGGLYPDFAFRLSGETKKDGAIALSITKPFVEGDDPVLVFSCTGVIHPASEMKYVPDYMLYSLDGVHNVFSFNEQRLAEFTAKVLPHMVRSVFSFIAKAPTSACQSFLDDLTDLGLLDMLLD